MYFQIKIKECPGNEWALNGGVGVNGNCECSIFGKK